MADTAAAEPPSAPPAAASLEDTHSLSSGSLSGGKDSAAPMPGARLRGGSAPLAGALLGAINRMESGPKIRASLAVSCWARVVGQQASAASEAETVRDGVLIVHTKSSVWSHELTLYKGALIGALNRMLGGRFIHDIVFRAQGLKEKAAAEVPEAPPAEELMAIVLDEPEAEELRRKLAALESLPDPRIRESIQNRQLHEARLRHWRLERGWRVCAQCAAVHRTEYDVCPICRLCR